MAPGRCGGRGRFRVYFRRRKKSGAEPRGKSAYLMTPVSVMAAALSAQPTGWGWVFCCKTQPALPGEGQETRTSVGEMIWMTSAGGAFGFRRPRFSDAQKPPVMV